MSDAVRRYPHGVDDVGIRLRWRAVRAPAGDARTGGAGANASCYGVTAPVISGVTLSAGPYRAGVPYVVTIALSSNGGSSNLTYTSIGAGATFAGGTGASQLVTFDEVGGPYDFDAVVSNGCGIATFPYSVASVLTTCTKTVVSSVVSEENPFGVPISISYELAGGGGGGGTNGPSATTGGGGGGRSSAILNGTSLVAVAAGGKGGLGYATPGSNGAEGIGMFTLAAGADLSVYAGGGGGGCTSGTGGGGSGYFGGGGGSFVGGGIGGSTTGGAGGVGGTPSAPTPAGTAGSANAGGSGVMGGSGGSGANGGAGNGSGGGGGGYGGGGGDGFGGAGGSNGANGATDSGSANGGAGALTFSSATTLPSGAGAGGTEGNGGAGGLVILVYGSPTGVCSL